MRSFSHQVSYDHRNYERNLSSCVQKPEKVRTSTGFEPAVQYMKHFIYHFRSFSVTMASSFEIDGEEYIGQE